MKFNWFKRKVYQPPIADPKRIDAIIRYRVKELLPTFQHEVITDKCLELLRCKDQLTYNHLRFRALKEELVVFTESGLYTATTKPYYRALAYLNPNDIDWMAKREDKGDLTIV